MLPPGLEARIGTEIGEKERVWQSERISQTAKEYSARLQVPYSSASTTKSKLLALSWVLACFFKCEYLWWAVSCPDITGHFASADGKQRENKKGYQVIKPGSLPLVPHFLLQGSTS